MDGPVEDGMRGVWMVLGAVMVSGCTPVGTPNGPSRDELRDQVLGADRRFNAAVARGDRAAFADLVAADAVFLGTVTLRGRAEVAESWSPLLDPEGPVSLRWAPDSAEVATSSDLAYTLGTYRLERRGEDGRVDAATGDYVTVWRRDPDGRWRAIVDSGTPPRGVEEAQATPAQ